MRETKFIEQNKAKWQTFEASEERSTHRPEELHRDFVQLTDDLSYSRTFYPNRSVRVYLNSLGQRIFSLVYRNRNTTSSRLTTFWTDELPRLLYEERGMLLLSFGVFVLSMLIGAFSGAGDADFARSIMGDAYVDMTIENIQNGDPMAVYKQAGEFDMFLGITLNNIQVALRTFVMGVFFALGSISILVQNGIMIGSFQYFFYEQGLLQESFLTIWTHGTLEISAIIIAGAAGMVLGKGLVFPGAYSRLQAFQITARRGIKILMGTLPIFVVAGVIESYVTRMTDTPDWLRLFFILFCLAFVIGYFVIYPMIKAQAGFESEDRLLRLSPDSNDHIDYGSIKSSGQLLTDTFTTARQTFGRMVLLAVTGAVAFAAAAYLTTPSPIGELYTFPTSTAVLTITDVLNHLTAGMLDLKNRWVWQFYGLADTGVVVPFVLGTSWTVLFSMVIIHLMQEHRQYFDERTVTLNPSARLGVLLNTAFIVSLLILLLVYLGIGGKVLFLLMLPISLLWMHTASQQGSNIFTGLADAFKLAFSDFGKLLAIYALVVLLSLLISRLYESQLAWMYLELFSINLSVGQDTMDLVVVLLLTVGGVFFVLLAMTMLCIALGLLHYSQLECVTARMLRTRLKTLGTGRRIRGMERE